MTKENIIALQEIDSNCNDCANMIRDFDTYKKWEDWNRELQKEQFDRKKETALRIANECQDQKGKETLLVLANKMKFYFDKKNLLQYGICSKYNKGVSFIPGVCQIETQHCFEHRRSVK